MSSRVQVNGSQHSPVFLGKPKRKYEIKKEFVVVGCVELGVRTTVKARTPKEAINIANRNRGGSQDLDWEDGNWESDVQSLEVRGDNDEIIAGESDITEI